MLRRTLIIWLMIAVSVIAGGSWRHDADTWTVYVTTGTSPSSLQDTIDFGRVIFRDWHATSLDAEFTLNASATTTGGVGLTDSGYLWLYHKTARGDYVLADSAFTDSLPVTLTVLIPDAIGNNTVFRDKFALVWRVWDTTSSAAVSVVPYDIDFDYTLKD